MKSPSERFVALDRRMAPVLAACATMLSCGGSVTAGTDVSTGGASGSSDAGPPADGNGMGDAQADRDNEASNSDGEAVDAAGPDAVPDVEGYMPLCDAILPEAETLGLWSSGDSVSLMVGASNERKLFLWSGSGWQTAFQGPYSSTLLGIRGRPDGAVFEYGLTPCGIRLIQSAVIYHPHSGWLDEGPQRGPRWRERGSSPYFFGEGG